MIETCSVSEYFCHKLRGILAEREAPSGGTALTHGPFTSDNVTDAPAFSLQLPAIDCGEAEMK